MKLTERDLKLAGVKVLKEAADVEEILRQDSLAIQKLADRYAKGKFIERQLAEYVPNGNKLADDVERVTSHLSKAVDELSDLSMSVSSFMDEGL